MTAERACQTSLPPAFALMDIDITLNGQPRSVPAGLTLLGLLEYLQIDPSRVAVELNQAIVRRPD